MVPESGGLKRSLSTLEFFTFGFGTMVGVGWVVLMGDWLGRGGPAGAALGFLLGALLLVPVGLTYGRLVRAIPDAGGEIAYTEGLFPPFASFAFGWTMVLAYAIVCPWEAVAIGNLLARMVPAMDTFPLYTVGGQTIFGPRLLTGLMLTGLIAWVNDRGIRASGAFQDITTLTFLGCAAAFGIAGLLHGSRAHLEPLFARPGPGGALLSVFLVVQVVPYFMTGFESVGKGAEEARAGFDPRGFSRAIMLSLIVGAGFYVAVVAITSYVFPWRTLVANHLGTEAAFGRAFGSPLLAKLILASALLSLVKIFNGNFLAATRLIFAIGRRGLVHRALGRVSPALGTPRAAVALMAALTAIASGLGDAVLVPTTEVGSLAVGCGWLSACLAYRMRGSLEGRSTALAGILVSAAIILMKVVPGVPGSFTRAEWLALGLWWALGLAFWLAARRR